MTEDHGFRWPDWLITVWNAVMFKRPVHPDEGVLYELRPRLALRVWRSLATPGRDGADEKMNVEITDEMVLRAARLLRWGGWDGAEGYPHDYLDLTVEPSPNLRGAARSALKAALYGIPANPYVTDGPAADQLASLPSSGSGRGTDG